MTLPDRPLAISFGTLPKDVEAKLKQLFTGPNAEVSSARVMDFLYDNRKVEVIGLSVEDCYLATLGRPSPYAGDTAEQYMRMELDRNRLYPEVVSEDEFDLLIADAAQGLAIDGVPLIPLRKTR